jgi:hypothetical protein
MSFCQDKKFVALSTDEEIGYIDLYNFLKTLSDNQEIDNELVDKFNLDIYKNLSNDKIKSKIGLLRENFEKRNKDLSNKKQKLMDILIINDSELVYSEKQLEKINNILEDKDFKKAIENIHNKLKNQELNEMDVKKYSFYKQLENQKLYLENKKIGSNANIVTNLKKHERIARQYRKVIKNIESEMKTGIEMEKITDEDKLEFKEVLDIFTNQKINKMIKKLDNDFNNNMNNSKINLKSKVIRSLMNLFNISNKQAVIIMSDKKFREKLFKNFNLDDVRVKLNMLNEELNEHSLIRDYLNQQDKQIQEKVILKLQHLENDPTARYSGITTDIGISGTFKQMSNKVIVERVQKLTIKESLKKSLTGQYELLLENGILNKKQYKKVEKIIDTELKRVKIGKLNNIQEIRNTIKVHISRILLEKYKINKNSIQNISGILSELTDNNTIFFENLFNNIIYYDTTEPFDVLSKLFNNMIDLLIKLKTIEKVKDDKKKKNKSIKQIKMIQDLLYKQQMRKVGKKGKGKNKEDEITYDSLNVMNLLLMMSYTEKDNNFSLELIEQIKQKVELNEEITNTNMWSWTSKDKLKDVISRLVNMETFDFRQILNEMIDDSELSESMVEMILITKNYKISSLKKMKKQFNILFDMFKKMYISKTIPHNLKTLDEVKSYFTGILSNLLFVFIEKLVSKGKNQKVKEFVFKNLYITSMYLNKESKFLKNPVIEQKKIIKSPKEEKLNNKDDLLNNFMEEDLDEEDYSSEDDYSSEEETIIEEEEENYIDVDEDQDQQDYE